MDGESGQNPILRIMLSIREVSKTYAGKTALDRINLEMAPGKILGLLGPNGAGKTSLIRIITMITAPDEGEVKMNGERMNGSMLRRIGYLPEERGLYKKMNILDQAIYFGRLKGLTKEQCTERINFWFERLEMSAWKKKKVEELSKGMQQKVQFVLTVLHEPSLIILDEPFTGFDPVNAEIIKEEIIRLKNNGASVILSTHRMESVEELCDDIALLNQSKLVLGGEVNEIRRQFQRPEYEVVYDGELNVQHMDVQHLRFEERKNGLKMAVITLGEQKDPNTLLLELMQSVNIHEFREKLPSIKDIFIELVGSKA